MQFQIVSHACASLRQGAVRLVLDPWLIGPVYWGAWWHCPEPVHDEGIFRPDYVYVTHWHFDHLHAESLRRFHRDTHFLVPAFPVSILKKTLCDLGFEKVTELAHAVPFELGPDFRITSWQIQYQDDSLCVIEGGGTVLVDLNDSKPLPRTWKKLQARHPRVDFMLRSHSPAWSYPSRYTFDDPREAIPVSRESYMQAFRSAAGLLRPRSAVPFASSVCHPHRDVLAENAEMVTAGELEAYWKRHPLAGTELVLMPPGSRWSAEAGFETAGRAVVRDVRAYVQEKAEANREWLERLYAEEERAVPRFETFQRFFRGFLCGHADLRSARTWDGGPRAR
jgi:UDP-MurNAc hydroxylase